MTHPLAQFTLPSDPAIWAGIFGVMATAYIYVNARRRTRKDPLAGNQPFSSISTQRRIENQMTDLLVELEKMTRQMNAQLDTRAAKLDEMIRQADERLAQLDERLADLRRLEGEPIRLPREGARGSAMPLGPEEPPPAPIPIDPRHAAVYQLADQGRSPTEIAREIGQPAGEVELILALRRRAR